MMKKQSMDVLGEALAAFARGDSSQFYLRDSSGRLFPTDLDRYFRTTEQMSKLELKLISLAYGDILDVGCGTGNYIPLLAKRGRVLGIDISPKIIRVARDRGCTNCRVANIFTYRTKMKFDTITFLGNGLGIGGSVTGTTQLLKKLSSMLKDDGQIFAIGRRVIQRDFVAVHLRAVWKQKIGRRFRWIHMSRDLLSCLCARAGLYLSVVQGNQHYFLIRISKNNPISGSE